VISACHDRVARAGASDQGLGECHAPDEIGISKDRKPETPGVDTTLTRRSDSEYAIDAS